MGTADINGIERSAKKWLGISLLWNRKEILKLCAELKSHRNGNKTLLKFIHITHRLDVPIALGTIVGDSVLRETKPTD